MTPENSWFSKEALSSENFHENENENENPNYFSYLVIKIRFFLPITLLSFIPFDPHT